MAADTAISGAGTMGHRGHVPPPHYYEWLGTEGTVDKVYLLQCSDMPILLRTAGQKLNSIWRFGRLSKKKTIARYSQWNCDPFLTCVRRLTYVIAVGWTSVRPSVRLSLRPSVTRWYWLSRFDTIYCVKTAQPIVKLSSLPGSLMILVFWGPNFSRNSNGNTLLGR